MLFGGFSSFLPTNMYITIWFLRETLQRMEHYIIIVYNGIAWRTVRRPSPNNNFGAFSVLSYFSFIAEWMCAKHRVYEMTASNNRGFDLFSHFSREFDNFLITEFRFRFFRILMEMEKNVSNGTEFDLKCAIFVWCHQSTLKIRSNKLIEISFLHLNSFWLRFAGGLLIFLIFYTLFDCFELVNSRIFKGFWWMLDRI